MSGPRVTGIAALAGVLACCAGGTERHLPPGTSVVLVVVDTLRADHLGSYGYARPTSPEIDRWADRGVLFGRSFSTAPWTLPSVASLLTGRRQHGAGLSRQPGAENSHARLDASLPTLAGVLGEAGYRCGAFVTNSFLRPPFGLDAGFETYDAGRHRQISKRHAEKMVDTALAWIDERRAEPFFLFLHLMDPHMPYEPRAPARGRFAGRAAGRFRVPLSTAQQIRQSEPPLEAAEREFVASLYDEEVAYVDLHVGRLLDGLAERGVTNRALIVLTADHGEELWEHGGFEHGHSLYQELLHVPLVFWAPGLRPARIDVPATGTDLFPTILEALGLPLPAGLDGASLWAAITGGGTPPARPIVAHDILYGDERQALLEWPWKLIVAARGEEFQLYDLSSDPAELLDRSASEPDRVRTLLARLRGALPQGAASTSGPEVPLSQDLRDELRALGYAEGAP